MVPMWALADQTNQNFIGTEDVICGRKSGLALTLDVFQPTNANGAGILWLVSSGYGSAHEAINPKYFRAFLARGYTVFAVVHGSAPKFSVPEIEPDILCDSTRRTTAWTRDGSAGHLRGWVFRSACRRISRPCADGKTCGVAGRGVIAEVWVLGDLAALDSILQANQAAIKSASPK
jgi:hypothetical protein